MLKTEALALAAIAHLGQKRKNGEAYIEHPCRVADKMGDDDDAIKLAYVHDVVEDTRWTIEDLRRAGLEPHLCVSLDAISRRKNADGTKESDEDYITRVLADPIATKVKKGDCEDNLDPRNAEGLSVEVQATIEAKYGAMMTRLQIGR